MNLQATTFPASVLLAALVFLGFEAAPTFAQPSPIRRAEQLPLVETFTQGRVVFRFDTFGDESFWGDTLQLHQAIAGQALGGAGPGGSPRTALNVGWANRDFNVGDVISLAPSLERFQTLLGEDRNSVLSFLASWGP